MAAAKTQLFGISNRTREKKNTGLWRRYTDSSYSDIMWASIEAYNRIKTDFRNALSDSNLTKMVLILEFGPH